MSDEWLSFYCPRFTITATVSLTIWSHEREIILVGSFCLTAKGASESNTVLDNATS